MFSPINKTVLLHFFHGRMWEELNVKNTPLWTWSRIRIIIKQYNCVSEEKTTGYLPNVQWLSARLQEMAVEILEVIIKDRILGQRGRDLPRPATHNKKIRKSWRLSSRTGSKASEVKICLVLSHTTTRLQNREGYHPGQDPGPTRSRSAASYHTQQED